MCGIVGLFIKNPELSSKLGDHLTTMLIGMTERGPDSAGIAIYHHDRDDDAAKLTLFHPDMDYAWRQLGGGIAEALEVETDVDIKNNHAVVTVFGGDEAAARAWIKETHPEVRVMGYGRTMEVYKDMGKPADVADKFGVRAMTGTHGIGHTRMATESLVTTEHSHPFTAASDICLVHNGSLASPNRMREWLEQRGMEFETDNDTEVAARYFAYRMSEGATLNEALEAGLKDLDGFYTFCLGTRGGFAVLRDPIACKHAVLAETDDWVAMASEFRSIAPLPGSDTATIWEPKPQTIYTWGVDAQATH
ncbi:MAG: amidophosphoribosyltransferase [Pseudomonadota bacterium]